MSRDRSGSAPPSSSRVEILRVNDNEHAVVRFLSGYEEYGLITHLVRRLPIPCPGAALCPSSYHSALTIWKGYAPVEMYLPAVQEWSPRVLEITEALEESLAGRELRGEVWHISRPRTKAKGNKVLGVYCETLGEEYLAKPFKCLPVLLRFYHVTSLVLGTPNPMPRTVILPNSKDVIPHLPEDMLPPAPHEQTAEERKKVAEEIRKAGGLGKMAQAAAERQRRAAEGEQPRPGKGV